MASGDIVQVLDTQDFAMFQANAIKCCARNKNIAVLASWNITDGDTLVRSIRISDAGLITAAPVASLVYHDESAHDIGLVQLYEDIFISIHQDDSGLVRLISLSVSDVGAIPLTREDLLQITTASTIGHVSDLLIVHDHVIITGESYPGPTKHVETAICSFLGTFQTPAEDSLVFSARPREQRFRHAFSTRIVAAFAAANHINIATFTCDAFGTVPATPTDTWDSFTSGAEYVSLCKIADLVYAIFTIDDDDKCRIRTFSINSNGTINKSFGTPEVVDDVGANFPYMVEMGFGYFIVAYQCPGVPGRVKTYHIADNGTITAGHIGTLDITTTTFSYPSMFHLQGNIWALVFVDSTLKVLVYTLEIVTPGVAITHHEMVMKVGP